jgi:2-polyprenyl-6-hydroxyphenyl methylase/3-demethylubiquinone-9 3-methyltransferase
MDRYYSDKLSALKLKRCYEVAPPRVRQYLNAEINHVMRYIGPDNTVLELGCGYGRVMKPFCRKARIVVGIDTSYSSLVLARKELSKINNYQLYRMDAVSTGFRHDAFDLVVCVQNGISAFNVNRLDLVKEAVRITKGNGRVLFSSYSEKFWEDRLEWFQLQADEGLLGEIDYSRTGDGVIVCKDGFKATTVRPEDFLALAASLNLAATIKEVDQSSIFCEVSIK